MKKGETVFANENTKGNVLITKNDYMFEKSCENGENE